MKVLRFSDEGSAVGSALKHELGANYRKTVNQE